MTNRRAISFAVCRPAPLECGQEAVPQAAERPLRLATIVLAAALVWGPPAVAQTEGVAAPLGAEAAAAEAPAPPHYVPAPPPPIPDGFPSGLAFLWRGIPNHWLRARMTHFAISPDHLGLTARAQPVLYWFARRRIDGPVEFRLGDIVARTSFPITTYPDGVAAGVHAVDLAEHGVTLEPGKFYTWAPESQISGTSIGVLRRVEVPADLAGEGDAHRLAKEGLWLDALHAAREEPDHFNALLRQVGLPDLARPKRR